MIDNKADMLVSIIIPCYNHGRYLIETLDSVLSQTYSQWECIVVDDGSIDDTENIVSLYTKKKRNIKYIYQENQGVCVARNAGIEKSLGKYILFLDGDDKISTNFLEISVPILEDNSSIKLVTPVVYFFGRYKGQYMLPEYTMEKLLSRNIFVITSLCRKDDIQRINGFNILMKKGLEDWDFWISLLSGGGDVVNCECISFYYRILTKSRNRTITDSDMLDLRKIVWMNHRELYAKYFLDPKESMEYRMLFESAEYRMGSRLLYIWRYIQKKLYFFAK